MLERIGTGIGSIYRLFLMDRLRGYGVKMLTKTKIREITEKGIIVEAEGENKTIEADTIVYAVGMKPNEDLFKELEGKIPELYAIGDCVKPRKSFEAIHEGSEIARRIL
jgi:2,4-dienoyl-CoA reductase (NADPH2)